MRWYVSCNGQVVGPVEPWELVEWVTTRPNLRGSDLYVRDEAASAWAPLEQSPFASLLGPSPAVPTVPIVQQVPVYYPQPTAPAYVDICRSCGAQGRKVQRSRMTSSAQGWFILLLFLCLPVAFLVLFLGRERYTVCQSCGSHG
jgi:hypothetical protein